MRTNRYTEGLLSFDQIIPPSFFEIKTSTSLPKKKTLLGIDLEIFSEDIKKLFFSQFGSMVTKLGFDPEDVLQEVYRGILVRNQGSPFNPAKAKFSTYVVMVCRCVVSNYITKHQKSKKEVQFSSDRLVTIENRYRQEDSHEDNLVSEARDSIKPEFRPVFNDLIAGYTKAEILDRHNLKITRLNQMIEQMRDVIQPLLS